MQTRIPTEKSLNHRKHKLNSRRSELNHGTWSSSLSHKQRQQEHCLGVFLARLLACFACQARPRVFRFLSLVPGPSFSFCVSGSLLFFFPKCFVRISHPPFVFVSLFHAFSLSLIGQERYTVRRQYVKKNDRIHSNPTSVSKIFMMLQNFTFYSITFPIYGRKRIRFYCNFEIVVKIC